MEVFLLPYLQLAEALFGQIQLNVRKFIQGNVAVLVLHQSDYDTEEDSVVSFLLTFKNEPPHATERKDGTANSVLSLAVLGIERKAFQGFLQLCCHKSAHINPKLFRLYKHLFLHHC